MRTIQACWHSAHQFLPPDSASPHETSTCRKQAMSCTERCSDSESSLLTLLLLFTEFRIRKMLVSAPPDHQGPRIIPHRQRRPHDLPRVARLRNDSKSRRTRYRHFCTDNSGMDVMVLLLDHVIHLCAHFLGLFIHTTVHHLDLLVS